MKTSKNKFWDSSKTESFGSFKNQKVLDSHRKYNFRDARNSSEFLHAQKSDGKKISDTEDFAYIAETNKSFDEAVVSVLREVEKKDWSIFQVYDIKERLEAKGFKQTPLKIIEICSGKHANNFLNKNKLISLCMPCKINVLEEQGKVKIIGMKPTIISQFFPEVSLEEAEQIEKDIKEIIDNAK